MTIELLLEKINMSKTYAPKIMDAYKKWRAENGAENCTNENARLLLTKPQTFANPELTISLLLFIAVEERNSGLWQRFPEEIFVNSMLVFTRSVDWAKEAVGYETYTKGPWPLLHASAKWFRLGELEFELNQENEKKEVHIHIPAKSRLTPEILKQTFKTEKAFMKEYFPDWADLTHSCESWMMSPCLKELLPADSKILYFQSLFDIQKYTPTYRWCLEFVFNLEVFQQQNLDFHTLREDTSLQRAMKKYILEGGNPGEAYGVLKTEIYED